FAGVPEIPEAVQHLVVIFRYRGVDFDEVEAWLETSGGHVGVETGEIAVGDERVVRLDHQSSLAARLFEDLRDGCRARVDGEPLRKREGVGVEMPPGRGELDPRYERNAALPCDRLQRSMIDGGVVVADKEQIEARVELRARQVRRRRDGLGLVGMVMEVRSKPPLRAGVELLSQHDADGLGGAGFERHAHFSRRREETAPRGYLEDIRSRGQGEISLPLGVELGKESLAPQELNELPLTLLDGDSCVQRGTVGVRDAHL